MGLNDAATARQGELAGISRLEAVVGELDMSESPAERARTMACSVGDPEAGHGIQ